MGLTQEDITEILGYLTIAEEVKPIVEKAAAMLKAYGPLLGEIFDAMGDHLRERTIKNFAEYQNGGFSREEAFLLVLSHKEAWREVFKNSTAQYKMKK